MKMPPLIAASVGAELFLSLTRSRGHGLTAVLTDTGAFGLVGKRVDCLLARFVSSTIRLDGIDGQVRSGGDFSEAETLVSIQNNKVFLCGGHADLPFLVR